MDKLHLLIEEQARELNFENFNPFIITPIVKCEKFNLSITHKAILALRLCGFMPKDIAKLLNISSSHTVSVTLQRIRRKFQISQDFKFPTPKEKAYSSPSLV